MSDNKKKPQTKTIQTNGKAAIISGLAATAALSDAEILVTDVEAAVSADFEKEPLMLNEGTEIMDDAVEVIDYAASTTAGDESFDPEVFADDFTSKGNPLPSEANEPLASGELSDYINNADVSDFIM